LQYHKTNPVTGRGYHRHILYARGAYENPEGIVS
jgi:hypothetical protein